ncbi:ATP-binding protein [Orrella daihaiensis]|uniref:histidine kinase n=1 Tax=Orrella daihaiensis TaxID=2782176 RepID=A0ABY4AKT4_9BURK|nr:ATP-binding protein [Orrella daihaiensis]UOD50901.1 HAMP domain-containing protein [Orrella daihaiensis]
MRWPGWRPLASLRSRLVLLVLATLLVAQALTVYVMVTYQRDELQTATANLLVTSITTLKSAISMVRPERQAMFVHHTSQGQWRLLDEPPPRGARFQSADGLEAGAQNAQAVRRSLRMLSREVNRALGSTARVAVSAGAQPYLYVSLGERPGQAPWLRIPLDRIDPPVRVPFLLWWLLALFVLAMIALWFSWHITRPITRLAKATDMLASGRPEPVKPSGPTETRRLGEHFNSMLEALAQTQQTQQTLLAGLPHDLKGPMARMALRIEMTEDQALKAGLKRDLADMQHMTEQFLDFLRGQDISRLRLEQLRLDRWLQEQVNERRQLGQDIALIGHLPILEVSADQAALQRLLNNLIDNALTHGKPPVEIALEQIDPKFACLTVSDHGAGLDPSQYERAFKPFERIDAARSRSGNVGLGLSLVKGIAIAHGGSVSLAAHASGGLSVQVKLPLSGGN